MNSRIKRRQKVGEIKSGETVAARKMRSGCSDTPERGLSTAGVWSLRSVQWIRDKSERCPPQKILSALTSRTDSKESLQTLLECTYIV